MKIFVPLLIGCTILTPRLLSAQSCADPVQYISFDTTVTGSGNAYYQFSLPKFDPQLGTLLEVTLKSDISLTYSFQLENKEAVQINNYRVRVTRDDEISSAALQTPITNTSMKNYGPYTLTAWDGVQGSGSDYIALGPVYVMNHTQYETTVYNTADYLGSGSVDYEYYSTTYSAVLGSINNYFNGTANDTLQFRILYTYCATSFLPADLILFNVVKNKEIGATLNWTTRDEEAGRIYEIQKSYDGRNFKTVDRQTSQLQGSATSNYSVSYSLGQDDEQQSRLIFRLRQIDANGKLRYSPIRIVDFKKTTMPRIRAYPNPARQSSTLVFDQQKRKNWQVDLLTLSGSLLKRYQFNNALTGRLDGLDQLPRGSYLIKATDRYTQETFLQQLLLQ